MTIAKAPFVADELDHLLFATFPGLVIRKDLAQEIRGTSKAPSYVIEFMLGKYCANLFDDAEVREGLRFVHEEVAKYIPRGDETEKIKADIREHSPHRLIDMVKVELDQSLKEGVYWAHLMTANIRHVNISPQIIAKYERLLMAGVWSKIALHYNDDIRYRGKTFPFEILRLDPIQVSHVDLEEYRAGREKFARDQWIDALIRTMGYEPTHPRITQRIKLLYLVRMIPLVESNYHMIELGPRQTGKSFCFTEFSPYGTLLAGGAVTIPKLFVSNMNPPQPGLIKQRDVVGFDEIAGSSFNADDDKNLYKNYMESGQINRGTITVVGDAGFVFNGNIEFDPREGMLAEHLFKPLPPAISDDMAFHDRWAAYLPGWELPKLTPDMFTPHVGFILDYTSEIFHRELRRISSYASLWDQWFVYPVDEWSARDLRSINRTFSGLTKLIFPSGVMEKEDARMLLRLAIELRLRVLVQLHIMNEQEFHVTELSFRDRESGEVEVVRVEV
ncbi:MAG TPA: BREX system Lon protease-like protein BrxL [Ktedonobacteraceae bacterium]|nr:BREX system Lon protease-like protein BrxL [Ktedonobacteraceae bacterium]